MKIRILKFIGILLLVIAVFVVIYAIYNLNYDYSGEKFRKNKASSIGLEEKQFNLKIHQDSKSWCIIFF